MLTWVKINLKLRLPSNEMKSNLIWNLIKVEKVIMILIGMKLELKQEVEFEWKSNLNGQLVRSCSMRNKSYVSS